MSKNWRTISVKRKDQILLIVFDLETYQSFVSGLYESASKTEQFTGTICFRLIIIWQSKKNIYQITKVIQRLKTGDLVYNCIQLHTIAYNCIQLYTIVYNCIQLPTIVHNCIQFKNPTGFCTRHLVGFVFYIQLYAIVCNCNLFWELETYNGNCSFVFHSTVSLCQLHSKK